MIIGPIKVKVSIRHMWLIKLINYPLFLMGFKPYIPKICFKVN